MPCSSAARPTCGQATGSRLYPAMAAGCLVIAGLLPAAASAADNQQIVAMVKAGVPSAAVIAAIRNAPDSYDRSPEALIALAKAGVAQDIVTALASSARPVNPSAVQSIPSPMSAVGSFQRVFAFDGDKRLELMNDFLGMGTSLSFSAHVNLKFNGARSINRLTSRTPRFQITLPASSPPMQVINALRLNDKDERRSTTIPIKGGMFGVPRLEVPKDRVVELVAEQVPDTTADAIGLKVWTVRTKQPLEPGEYAIAGGQMSYFSFGID